MSRNHLFGALAALLLTACGPTFTVEPLAGEDPEILTMIGVSAADLQTPETVAATEEFYSELWSARTQGMWELLSRDTRVALDALAQKLNTNGRAMLQSRLFPKAGGGSKRVSLSALFMVRRPTSFRAAGKTTPASTDAEVLVSNRKGEQVKVKLHRERGAWKLHKTDFSKLPVAIDLKPKLLPQDQPKPIPAPAPQPEPQDEDEDSEDEEEDSEPTAPDANPDAKPGDKPPAPPEPDRDLDF